MSDFKNHPLNFYNFDKVTLIQEVHGIVYIQRQDVKGFFIYLKERPGVFTNAEFIEDGPFKIKEVLDCIEGWED